MSYLRVITRGFGGTSKHTIIFLPFSLHIYFEDCLVATLQTPYRIHQIPDLIFFHGVNSRYVGHKDHALRELIRVKYRNPSQKGLSPSEWEKNRFYNLIDPDDHTNWTFNTVTV